MYNSFLVGALLSSIQNCFISNVSSPHTFLVFFCSMWTPWTVFSDFPREVRENMKWKVKPEKTDENLEEEDMEREDKEDKH